VITIFGTTYFTTGAGLVVLVLAAPFLFWFARWLWRPNVEDKPWRVRLLAVGGTTFGLLALLAIGLFWDVYLIGQRAKVLCQETGLVVHESASTDSVSGLSAIEIWNDYGFSFVEYQTGDKRFRSAIKEGQILREEIDEFTSAYQFESHLKPLASSNHGVDRFFMRRFDEVVRRSDKKRLGELSAVSISTGWFDRSLIRASGFSSRPWLCGKSRTGGLTYREDRMSHADLIRCTLKPLDAPGRGHNERDGYSAECVVR
jgi:hypothetical protein